MKLSNLFFIVFVFVAISSCAQQGSTSSTRKSAGAKNLTQMVLPMGIDSNWSAKIIKTDAEWKNLLTPEQYNIAREKGTERPFSSSLNDIHEDGLFVCSNCDNPLFSYVTKFNSGTGWPSFFQPFSAKSVNVGADNSHGMQRDEVTCQKCDAHLGHVFNDGPRPTGERYCMNGISLKFIAATAISETKNLKKATLAGGCFWCEEKVFESVIGVGDVISGYAGGKESNPTYKEVGSGKLGHAEAFEFEYDSSKISFADLLKVYFASIDPTQVNGQGPDNGTQYRSIIFYRNATEQKIAIDYIAELNNSKAYNAPIAVEVVPFVKFWIGEDYHQNYVDNNPDNGYVQQESIPRFKRTKAKVPEFFK